MNVNAVNSSAPPPCEICESVDHLTLNCQVGTPFAQDANEVNYVNNFNSRPTNDPYSKGSAPLQSTKILQSSSWYSDG